MHTKPHSEEAKRKMALARKGIYIKEKCPSWKGGITINKDGYIMIRIERKSYRKHRLVMEKYLDRKLKSNEIVHHKNGIKTDNRLKNLELLSKKEHASFHAKRQHKENGFFAKKI